MIVLLLLLLVLPAIASSFPLTTTFSDDFNRANEDPVAGIWTDSLYGDDGCEVLNNVLVRSGTTNPGCYVTQTVSGYQEIFVYFPDETNVADNTNYFMWLCAQDVGTAGLDGYGIRVRAQTLSQTDIIQVMRKDNGVNTQLGTNIFLTHRSGDGLGISYDPVTSNIEVFWDDDGGGWVSQRVETDTSLSCDNTHLALEMNDATHQMDDFGGGDLQAEVVETLSGDIIFW